MTWRPVSTGMTILEKWRRKERRIIIRGASIWWLNDDGMPMIILFICSMGCLSTGKKDALKGKETWHCALKPLPVFYLLTSGNAWKETGTFLSVQVPFLQTLLCTASPWYLLYSVVGEEIMYYGQAILHCGHSVTSSHVVVWTYSTISLLLVLFFNAIILYILMMILVLFILYCGSFSVLFFYFLFLHTSWWWYYWGEKKVVGSDWDAVLCPCLLLTYGSCTHILFFLLFLSDEW